MSNISIDSWNDFMYKVGEDFYTFIHGVDENSDEYTTTVYPVALDYDGVYFVYTSGTGNANRFPILGHFTASYNQSLVFSGKPMINCNYTGSTIMNDYELQDDYEFTIEAPHSFFVSSTNYWVQGGSSLLGLKKADGTYQYNIFKALCNYRLKRISDGYIRSGSDIEIQDLLKVNSNSVYLQYNYNGYDYYMGYTYEPPSFYFDSSGIPNSSGNGLTAPSIVRNAPCIVNSNYFNSNLTTLITNIQNNYIDSGDTITNYTYNIDNDNYITVNYSIDGNGVPSGYIDVNPTGNISFDDLFDMFNTILAPLVGVGLDLPDWTDYEPEYPIVTGNTNVNINLPDVTGQYPAETITPIESDVYNIMSIDSMPQLPSLTGIDNGESAAVLGSSFTFLDGCGLLMPFVTIAIIRLLISKFRGDS